MLHGQRIRCGNWYSISSDNIFNPDQFDGHLITCRPKLIECDFCGKRYKAKKAERHAKKCKELKKILSDQNPRRSSSSIPADRETAGSRFGPPFMKCSLCSEEVEINEWNDHLYAHRLQVELDPGSAAHAPFVANSLQSTDASSGSEREIIHLVLCTVCNKTFSVSEYADHALAHRLERQLQIIDGPRENELVRRNTHSTSRPSTRIELTAVPRTRRTMRLPPNLDAYLERRDVNTTYERAATLAAPSSSESVIKEAKESRARSKSAKRKKHKESTVENCTICLERMRKGEKLKFMPCVHKFHEKCIETWLRSHRVCPICRQG